MIFTDELVFIHSPKTGGMSCSRFLLRGLKGRVFNCHTNAEEECHRLGRANLIPVRDINRHCTLAAAMGHIQRLDDQATGKDRQVLAVIRHPFSLEYSFFRHLQKPHIAKRRRQKSPELIELAMGDFKNFVARAGYHRQGLRQEDYFLIDGQLPENVRLVRYEALASEFPKAVKAAGGALRNVPFPHLNPSGATARELEALLDMQLRELLYEKHRYLFDQGYYQP